MFIWNYNSYYTICYICYYAYYNYITMAYYTDSCFFIFLFKVKLIIIYFNAIWLIEFKKTLVCSVTTHNLNDIFIMRSNFSIIDVSRAPLWELITIYNTTSVNQPALSKNIIICQIPLLCCVFGCLQVSMVIL